MVIKCHKFFKKVKYIFIIQNFKKIRISDIKYVLESGSYMVGDSTVTPMGS